MNLRTEHAPVESTQRIYARLAGILFLWLIISVVFLALIFPHIPVSGTFAEREARITASEHLYRLGLTFEVIVGLSAVLLAFALYVILKCVSNLIALVAMIFYLQDSFLAGVVQMCGFVRLNLYTSPQTIGIGTVSAQALTDLMRSIARAAENIGGISFGTALLLFFYLFFRSKYIPRVVAALGLVASFTWTALYFSNLIFAEQQMVFRYICFPLMAITCVITGLWLMLFAVNTSAVIRFE